MYIAGGGEAIGALSMLGGLYVVNQSTKQWELKYKDTVRAYGYAHLARFSTGWVFYKGAGGDGKNYVIIVYDNGTVKELSIVNAPYSISTGPFNFCCVGAYYQGELGYIPSQLRLRQILLLIILLECSHQMQ
nr:MAG: hypothetical protein [Bacteriophage sp.]